MENVAYKQVQYPATPGCSTSSSPTESMKADPMSEPISSTAAGVFGWKALGGLAGAAGIGAGVSAYVVMSMTKPKSDQEWHVSLISTLMGSFCGGPALVKYLGLEHWIFDPFGLMGLLGICFTCGLPSWLLVRGFFAYMDKKKNADITEIIGDGVQAVKQIKDAI